MAQFGETLADRNRTDITTAPPIREVEPARQDIPASKQPPAEKLYPKLPPAKDDGFEYFDTPTKLRPQSRGKRTIDENIYDWEESDEDIAYKKTLFLSHITPAKRPHFEMETQDISPPLSPQPKKRSSPDPFTTPPKQITSTPHTPPDTHVKPSRTHLLPLSYALLHRLSDHSASLGTNLWENLNEHLIRCGRVADGAVKGRDAARAVSRKKDIRIEELERRIRILEAEREVDRAVISALKRNVDVLTGKTIRTD